MTTPPDNNQPSTEQSPAPEHFISSRPLGELVARFVTLQQHLLVPSSTDCLVGVPGPNGMILHAISTVMTGLIHSRTANPDDPSEPAGQPVIIIVTAPDPQPKEHPNVK